LRRLLPSNPIFEPRPHRCRHQDWHFPFASRHHDRSAVLVRQHRAAAATSHLARHPVCGLLRHQNRLNLSQHSAAFGKRQSQVGNAAILPLHHVHDRCFSCGGARLRTLEAGFDNQSRGNSERLARFSSLAEATGSEKSPRLGRWVRRDQLAHRRFTGVKSGKSPPTIWFTLGANRR
jgi:hypothetical protein